MPAPNPKITIVCLPDTIPTSQLAAAALAAHRKATAHRSRRSAPLSHFPIRSGRRARARLLLQPWQGRAAGGPVHLLDLDLIEHGAAQHAWYRWHTWNHIVRGTRPAAPFWRFVERHHQDPVRYPLDRAQQDYLAQPRVQAMHIHNHAVPVGQRIPTSHLEALQVTCDAYVSLQCLLAVPAAGLITLDRTLLTYADERLHTLHSYAGQAHAYLHRLTGSHQLVALATT